MEIQISRSAKDRDVSVEILRVLLMLGICISHSRNVLHISEPWIISWFFPACVPCFVFISGWYGMHFNVRKILKLYGVAVVCLFISVAAEYFVCGIKASLHSVGRIFCSWWFLHAYAVLMCCVSPVNICITALQDDRKKLMTVFFPFLLAVFGWGWVSSYRCAHGFVPYRLELDAYSAGTLIAIYVVGRIARQYEKFLLKQTIDVVLVTLVASISLGTIVKMGSYNSPFVLANAALVFLLFKRLAFSVRLSKFVPYVFPIYLLHYNRAGFELMRRAGEFGASVLPPPLVPVLAGVFVFASACILDVPRCFCLRMVSQLMDLAYRREARAR